MEFGREDNPVKRKLPLSFLAKPIKLPLFGLLILVLVTFVASSLYLSKYPNSLGFLGITLDEQLEQQKENEETVKQVGKLMDLPTDEEPTVATVTDVSAVANQPFFRNAQNGDRVLIYRNAQKAILFRPGEDRIIEVGAVNLNNDNQVQLQEDVQAESDAEATPTVSDTSETIPTVTPTSATATPVVDIEE